METITPHSLGGFDVVSQKVIGKKNMFVFDLEPRVKVLEAKVADVAREQEQISRKLDRVLDKLEVLTTQIQDLKVDVKSVKAQGEENKSDLSFLKGEAKAEAKYQDLLLRIAIPIAAVVLGWYLRGLSMPS